MTAEKANKLITLKSIEFNVHSKFEFHAKMSNPSK